MTHCKRMYSIIPDALGFRIDLARVPQDWSLTGYVARTIGRVYIRREPEANCLRCDRVIRGGMFCGSCRWELSHPAEEW